MRCTGMCLWQRDPGKHAAGQNAINARVVPAGHFTDDGVSQVYGRAA